MDLVTASHAGIAGVRLEATNTAAVATTPQPHAEHTRLSEPPEHVRIKVEEEFETSETFLASTTTSPWLSSPLESIENQPTAHPIPSWAKDAKLDGKALSRFLNELVDGISKVPDTQKHKSLSDTQRMATIKHLIKRLRRLADSAVAREIAHGTENSTSAAGRKRSSSSLSTQEPESSKRQKENTACTEERVISKAEKSRSLRLPSESYASNRENGAASRELPELFTKAQVPSSSSTLGDGEDPERCENFTSPNEREVLIKTEPGLEQPAFPPGPVRERPGHVSQPLGPPRRFNQTHYPSHPTLGSQHPRHVVPYTLPLELTRSPAVPPSPPVARGRLLLPPVPSRFLLRASTYTSPTAISRATSLFFTSDRPNNLYEPVPPVRSSAPWAARVARQAAAFDRQLETAYQNQRHRSPYVYVPWHHRRERPDARDRRWNIFNLGNLGEGSAGELRGRRITSEILVTALCNAPENSGAQRGWVCKERTVMELVQVVKEKRRACRPEDGWTPDWFDLPNWTHWWDKMELVQGGH